MKKILRKLKNLLIPNDDPAQKEMQFLIAHGLRVGKNFRSFSPYAFDSNWPWLITVGDDVTISTNVKVLAHDASTNHVGAHTKIGLVSIGNNVFVGSGSIILCNTRIGDNVIIGANSVVSHDIPGNSVAAGNPAKIICSIEEYQTKHLEALQTHPYFNQHSWDAWMNASPAEWEMMRSKLKDTFGYV